MIQINLIRGKRKKRRGDFDVGALFLFIPFIVAAGIVYFHIVVLGEKEANYRRDIQHVNAEIERLKKDIEEVEEFYRRKVELQTKVDIIDKLQSDRVGPVRHLEALSSAIPERCWIDKLEIMGPVLSVSGVALNNNTVANFMMALAQTGRFRDIVLGSADQASVLNTKL
ncbi:MAG: PilN domain-containing protein, partial [Syntrophorhabdaceae bacterium]|nr:PilN domain-containing protein [Syntrophorhabdaceae bacterium]